MPTTETLDDQNSPEAPFDDSDDRADEMRATLEEWAANLAELTDEALASEQFREWLDVHSRFHDYSHRNTLLINLQCPDATKVAGYWTWQNEFDRHVKEGESGIWIWAPIVAQQCPDCGNAPSYCDHGDCSYDTPQDEWREGAVGFKPTTVFDVSQTQGEPLPALDTETVGKAGSLVEDLLAAADQLGIGVEIVPPAEWPHGPNRKGVCERRSLTTTNPVVEVRGRPNDADLASTLIHEYAHALLHVEPEADEQEAALEVEAEAVAYVVCRYLGLDPDNARFYLAAWDDDAPETVHDRLQRITETAVEVINTVES